MTHKPPKIVHIIIGLNVGGAELMLKRLVLNSQAKSEFKHEVISLTDLGVIGVDLKKAGIPVYTLNMKSAFSILRVYFSLKKILKQIKPDVVQTWMYHADFIGGMAAKSVGIKNIIWGIRTTDVTQGASQLTVALRNICARLSYSIPSKIVCAAYAAKDLHGKIGYDVTKMVVIPNGFELDKLIATDEDRKFLRKELDLSDTDIVIGSVGRFNEVKNQKLFVEIAAVLVKDFPSLKFMMVGRDNDKNNKTLMGWIQGYDLEDNFRLLGQQVNVSKCLKAMDIFLLHSKTEGFPNVLGEAMAVGVIAVSTNAGDVACLIDQEFIGSDLKELQVIINKILNNEIYTKDVILNNKKNIEENFSMNSVVSKFESLYQDC